MVLECLRHGSVPFVQVVRALSELQRSGSRSPVYQTMFLWEEGFGQSTMLQMTGLEVHDVWGNQAASVELELHLAPSGHSPDDWAGHISYDVTMYQAVTVQPRLCLELTLTVCRLLA